MSPLELKVVNLPRKKVWDALRYGPPLIILEQEINAHPSEILFLFFFFYTTLLINIRIIVPRANSHQSWVLQVHNVTKLDSFFSSLPSEA